MRNKQFNFSSNLLNEFDRFLKIVSNETHTPTQPTPLADTSEVNLSETDKKNIQGLMRINHTGEVCAQALYYGQALYAKDSETKQQLMQAADEEHNHLYWCQERLNDLHSHTSILNPIW
jgi:ubiquinone biosynthesis monooxygenase Coq7